MRKVFAGFSLTIALLLPGQALAWNHKGHMVVAYIAYQELTPEERSLVFQTLKAHGDFAKLSQLAGSPQSSNYRMLLFVHASRWPDLIRDDPRFYDDTDPHAKPTKKLKSFPDMKKHKPWHFKDLGFSTDGTSVDQPDPINAEVVIRAFTQNIGNPWVSTPHKAYFLSWLEHLIGDVHQPLHCVSRFTQAHPKGDRGGNLFEIAPFQIPGVPFQTENLHSFWDSVLGAETTLAAIKATASQAMKSSPTESGDDPDGARWVTESFQYAQSAAYKPLDGQPSPATITGAYFDNARALALERVKLAGLRLAAIIKNNLK